MFSILYKHSPIILQNIAISLYGYKIKKLRFGSDYKNFYEYLISSDMKDCEFLLQQQQMFLRELINYASNNIPFYKQRIEKDACFDSDIDCLEVLQKLPIVTKGYIKSHQDDFISSQFTKNRLNKLKTSGTTGTPFTIYSTKVAIERNYAFFSRFLSWHGVAIDDPQATFAGRVIIPDNQINPPYWRYNKARKQMLFSSYHLSNKTIPSYIEALEKLNPSFIDAFPTPIFVISQYINKHGINHKIRPKVIITSSEVLTEHFRESIESAFGCPVADQYGAAEMAGFIGQCEHGRYHIAPEFGITEILKEDGSPALPGEKGQLICTGFLNKAMPFIRYQTGDSVILSETPCNCGRESLAMTKILGRTDDLLITREGRMVSGMGIIFKGIKHLQEAQIIQEDLDNITIKMVCDRVLTPDEELELRTDLQNRIGIVKNVTISYCDDIKRTKGGKLQTVISKVPHELIGHK